jgi:hypothetical protein
MKITDQEVTIAEAESTTTELRQKLLKIKIDNEEKYALFEVQLKKIVLR